MKIGHQKEFIVMKRQANSLLSLLADGKYRKTTMGRDTWKTLIGPQASLQHNCNIERFNARGSKGYSRARNGFLGNNGKDCVTPDSRIGFGTGGYKDDSNTCGNVAAHSTDNGTSTSKPWGTSWCRDKRLKLQA